MKEKKLSRPLGSFFHSTTRVRTSQWLIARDYKNTRKALALSKLADQVGKARRRDEGWQPGVLSLPCRC